MPRGRLLQLLLGSALLVVLLVRLDPAELWRVLRDAEPRYAALALALNLPVALLAGLRSALLFRALGHRVPAGLLLATSVVGFVAGGLTPAASGELLRALPLRAGAGVPYEHSAAAIVYERGLALYLMSLSTAAVAALLELPVILAALAGAAALGLLLLPRLAIAALGPLLRRPPPVGQQPLPRAWRFLLTAARQVQGLLQDLRLLVACSLVTLALFALIAVQYWLLARGLSDEVDLGEAWLAFGLSSVAAVLTLLPAGLGVLDGSLAAVLAGRGLTLAQGGVVALLVRATVTLPLLVAAFACYLWLQRGAWRQQVANGERMSQPGAAEERTPGRP